MEKRSDFRTRYPAIEPFNSGFLQVDIEHSVYFEQCGNPKGKPVIFLHGGPGSGCDVKHREFFNPEIYHIILFDQRGAGKSVPFASLNNNTTWDLVGDIEKIREKLKIDKWVVFGGSWGSTLALAYAETHPDRCKALILRGIFLCRPKEITWFYQFGAHHIYPDEWERYLAPIPENERGDLVNNYYKRLTSTNEAVQLEAAKAWARWEGACLKLVPDAKELDSFTADHHSVSLARIECHYFVNNAFFKTDNWLIENIAKIKDIPAVIIHGRYDVVCPIENAWELHKAYPKAKLQIIQDAGHAASEPGIVDALVRAADEFAQL